MLPLRSKLFGALATGVGLALLVLLIVRVNFAAVRTQLLRVGWWFLPVFALHAASLVISTRAWQTVIATQRSRATYVELLTVFWAGHAVNYLTPGGTLGEVLRGTALTDEVDAEELAASVISYNACSLLVVQGMMVLGPIVALLFLTLPRPLVLAMLAATLTAGLLIALLLLLLRWGAIYRLVRLLSKLPLLRNLNTERSVAKATAIDACVRRLARERPRDLLRAAGLLVGARMMSQLQTWLLLAIFLPNQPVRQLLAVAIFSLSGSQLMSWFISFIPGQVGFSEGGMTLLFKMMGFNPVVGLSIELARRVIMVVTVAVGLTLGARILRRKTLAAASFRASSR